MDSSTTQPPNEEPKKKSEKKAISTTHRFFLRGLAISLPPILTLVIVIWVAGIVNNYIIVPTTTTVRYSFAYFMDASQPRENFVQLENLPSLEYCRKDYLISKSKIPELNKLEKNSGKRVTQNMVMSFAWVPFGDRAVPYTDYREVAKRIRASDMPTTAIGLYMELATTRWFKSLFQLSAVAVALTIVALYFLGRFVTARVGSWMVLKFEQGVLARLPVVSNVYSSVKQVTDFFFSERTVNYSRVVAVEYPRRGIWSLGFVTGDSMLEMTVTAGEPLVAILIPTSPMPVTGYTMSIPKSEIVDLNITVDQAFQFCLSCGVLVPPQQRVTDELLREELGKRLLGDRKLAGFNVQIVPPESAPHTSTIESESTTSETQTEEPETDPSHNQEQPPETK
ncbi:MAG: DUF502 domain-containing protein [Planctomycetes bacterium]|nr:DUF502 domain-containing protein [Planctomycetota bacterium]MCH9727157.1 DUF502 domain-containing protein [Planctomycetota bacterium]MCH9778550.1 DUF502 domain-containing protein [Planctomycetota bacterium]MCH9791138.1 DUF502 domain-containing protein [Planctomycetota bacterium]